MRTLRAGFVVVLLSVGLAFASPTPLGAASATPSIVASLAVDVARGGADLTVDLHEFGLPDGDFVGIEASLGGTPVLFGFYGDPYAEVPCAVVDVGGTPVNRCEVFVQEARSAGTYDISVHVGAPFDDTFTTTATLPVDIPAWWDDFAVDRASDIFTGAATMTVDFVSLPSEVTDIELLALGDDDYDGFPEVRLASLDCAVDTALGTATCTTTRPIPRRCVEDSIGGSFCDIDPTVFFTANGIPVDGLAYDGTHYRLSRLDEGMFFGRRDAEAGVPLADTIDLDTYRLPFVEPCYDVNASYCFDAGYYLAWLRAWRGTVADDGTVETTTTDGGTEITATIPHLPAGDHGVRAEAVFTGPDGVVRVALDCDADGCPSTSVSLAAGTWDVAVELVNAHPFTTYEDESTWGGEVLARVLGAPVTVEAPADEISAFRGWYTRGKRSTDGRIRTWGWARNGDAGTQGRFGLRAWVDGRSFVVHDGQVEALARVGDRIVTTGVGLVDGEAVTWTQIFVERGDAEPDRLRVVVMADGAVRFDTDAGLPLDALPTRRVPTANYSADR